MSNKQYLTQRRGTWFAVVEVPKPLRVKLADDDGKPKVRFIQSLKTSSLNEANRLKLPLVAEWHSKIEMARAGTTDPMMEVKRVAMGWREARLAPEGRVRNVPKEVDENADIIPSSNQLSDAINDVAGLVEDILGVEASRQFRELVNSDKAFIKDTYTLWRDQLDVAGQTKVQHETAIKRFMDAKDTPAIVEDVTRKAAGAYINDLLASSGLTRRTIQRHASSLSSLWKWYIARGYVEVNPWIGHGLSSKKGRKKLRSGLSNETLVKLLQSPYRNDRYGTIAPDLLRLGLITGARLEALCSLRASNIEKREDGYWVRIEGDKTEAGNRTIPVHAAADPIIKRRLADEDEFLFKDLKPGGPDKKRSWFVGRAYKRLRESAGVSAKGEDFHALRNTYIECMEGLGVPESTVKLLVGHARSSMTYGHYSKGDRLNLREAVDQLDYGPDVMKLLEASSAS